MSERLPTLLATIVLATAAPAAAGESQTLVFGQRSATDGIRLDDLYIADCFSTEAPLLVENLHWSTSYWEEDAYFSFKPTFSVGSLGTDGTLTTVWSALPDEHTSTEESCTYIDVVLPTAGTYCVAITPSAAEPAGQGMALDENSDARRFVVDGGSFVVAPVGWCYGNADELDAGFAACTEMDGYQTLGFHLEVEVELLDRDRDGDPAALDCNDEVDDVSHDAVERCNLVDDDCDGVVDDGVDADWFLDLDQDGFGGNTPVGCTVAGAVQSDSDCDDSDAAIHPGADELCDGVDNDCDGALDSDVQETERCNAIDDDCDGEVDEHPFDDGEAWFRDRDGDGIGDDATEELACEWPGLGFTRVGGDCDDADFFRAADCSEHACAPAGGVQITVCEITAALVVAPAFLVRRRRRR